MEKIYVAIYRVNNFYRIQFSNEKRDIIDGITRLGPQESLPYIGETSKVSGKSLLTKYIEKVNRNGGYNSRLVRKILED